MGESREEVHLLLARFGVCAVLGGAVREPEAQTEYDHLSRENYVREAVLVVAIREGLGVVDVVVF